MEGPEFYQSLYSSSDNKTGDHFFVEEFLDFSNADASDAVATAPALDASVGIASSAESSPNPVDSSFLPIVASGEVSDSQFSGDLCVPYDDLAELEWLSNIVEESFSSEDLKKLQLISGIKGLSSNAEAAESREEQRQRAAKARSKRSRAPPCNWSSRLLLLSPDSSASTSSDTSSEGADRPVAGPAKKAPRKKEQQQQGGGGEGEGRRCLHCATDKTPQWRTGPMGPKTLCNACGVRYKSGRLVPEYRPAASPTFVLTKHSNSHRKVLELRRQKDFARATTTHHHHPHFLQHHQNSGVVYDSHAPPSSNSEDFLIHHHSTPDYRQMI